MTREEKEKLLEICDDFEKKIKIQFQEFKEQYGIEFDMDRYNDRKDYPLNGAHDIHALLTCLDPIPTEQNFIPYMKINGRYEFLYTYTCGV